MTRESGVGAGSPRAANTTHDFEGGGGCKGEESVGDVRVIVEVDGGHGGCGGVVRVEGQVDGRHACRRMVNDSVAGVGEQTMGTSMQRAAYVCDAEPLATTSGCA